MKLLSHYSCWGRLSVTYVPLSYSYFYKESISHTMHETLTNSLVLWVESFLWSVAPALSEMMKHLFTFPQAKSHNIDKHTYHSNMLTSPLYKELAGW